MAKKRTTKRERPTLAQVNELHVWLHDLRSQVSQSTALLTDIQAADTALLARQIKQADSLSEARGLLHSILDELGMESVSPVVNKARRFLGRPENQPKSTVQRLIESHATANSELAIAS